MTRPVAPIRVPCAKAWAWAAFAAFSLVLSGCGKQAALSFRVSGRSHAAFEAWKSTVRPEMPPYLEADFDDAVKEIGLRAQAGGAVDEGNLEAKTLSLIDGKTVRGVIRTGLGWKLKRLILQKELLTNMLGTGSQRGAMPGDKGSADQGDLHAMQRQQMKDVDAQIGLATGKLKALGDPINDADGPWDPALAPTPLPPEPPVIRLQGL